MTKLIFSIKTFFISFEFLIYVVFLLFGILHIDLLFSELAEFLFSDLTLETLAYIFSLPSILIVLSYKLVPKFLEPDTNLKIFYQWDEYYKLKITVYIGLLFNLFPLILNVTIILIGDMMSNFIIGLMYIAFCSASTISTVSLFLESQRMKEKIEQNS